MAESVSHKNDLCLGKLGKFMFDGMIRMMYEYISTNVYVLWYASSVVLLLIIINCVYAYREIYYMTMIVISM